MIQLGEEEVEPGIHVVVWLRDAVRKPPANPDEWSPSLRLKPALQAADADDRDPSLLALFDALSDSDDAFRQHLLYALDGFSTDALVERYVDLLPPRPRRWLIMPRPGTDHSIPELVFDTISNGPGRDDRLRSGMLALGRRVLSDERFMSYCVSFYPLDEGIDMAHRHLDGGKPVGESTGWGLGVGFGRDAPEHLAALAYKLRSYPTEVRAKFLAGAAVCLSEEDRGPLAVALGL